MRDANILFVDDDKLYLMLVKNIVEQAGVKARYAQSGQEAVGILKDKEFATLVTDLNMPGMDGFQLAEAAMNLYPDIRIVMMTNYMSQDIPLFAATAGISEIILKPFTADKIREIIAASPVRHVGCSWKRT